jgi:hypothetical protein
LVFLLRTNFNTTEHAQQHNSEKNTVGKFKNKTY